MIIFNQKQAHMYRLSFEHCYLINLVILNVSVEKFILNSPSMNLNGIKFGMNLRMTNKQAAVFSKTRAWAKIYQLNGKRHVILLP